MKSRIHLAIGYVPPHLEMRGLIWTQCLQAIPEAERDIDIEEDIDSLIRDKINGREISNTVHTSRTLALFENQGLQLSHIETVLQTRRDFDVSLDKQAKSLVAAQTRQDSMMSLGRKNSILMTSHGSSKWLP